MHNLIGILLGVFVICILLASHFTRSALRSLGDSHRSELVRIAANSSMMNIAAPIIIAIGYVVFVMSARDQLPTATVAALGLLLIHSVVTAVIADRAYRVAGMPRDFLRFFRLARGTRILGALLLFTGIVCWLVFARGFQEMGYEQHSTEVHFEDSAVRSTAP